MSDHDKHRAVTTASASVSTAAVAAAVGDRSQLESRLFDSPPADCSDCTNPNCPDRRLRLQAEADATALSASPSVSSSAPAPAPAPAVVAAPGPRKKCSQCSRDRPESSFSNAQLKLKGRRQCRDCIDPICTVCGKGDFARASGAPAPCPATSTLRPLLVKRPRPAADFIIMSHYSCANMLSGRIDNLNASPTAIAGVPAELCAILASHCGHCDRDGGALQCGGCSRVYHATCGGVLEYAKLKEGSVYPSNMRSCHHCTARHAPLSSSASGTNPSLPPSSSSDLFAFVCAACGFIDAGEVTGGTSNRNRLQPVRVEMKPAELLLFMHIGCARQLTELSQAQLVMPPAGSSNADGSFDEPLLKDLSEHLQSTLSGACACCRKPGGTARCSCCSSRFHHLCLGAQLNRIDEAFATAPMRSCPVCTQLHQTIDRPSSEAAFRAVEALAGAAITGASPSATATSGSSSSAAASSSSSSAIPAGFKKCAQCHLHLPESDYSASQLKARGKRQCKSCLAEAQSLQALSPADAETKKIRSRITALTPHLFSPLESDQARAIRELTLLFDELDNKKFAFSVGARIWTRLVELMAGSPSDTLRFLSLGCIAMMALCAEPQSPLFSTVVESAGAISCIVSTLQQPEYFAGVHGMCLQVLMGIAQASPGNCDKLLAANALGPLLQLVRADSVSELRDREHLFPTLVSLLRGRVAAEAAVRAAVTHFGAVIMAKEGAAQPQLLCACLNTFGKVLIDFADEDPNLNSWAKSMLSAAPGFPRRLVELLGDRDSPDVAAAALRLMSDMFRAETDQLLRLFDCGLLDKLPLLLSDAARETTRLGAVNLCCNAARTKAHALSLVDSAAIVQRMLGLLSTSQGEMLHAAVGILANMSGHFDRHITRRLVDDYRALPPLVAALRRVTESGDQTVTLWCLSTLAHVLLVGVAESEDDERGVNPYIEPIDWLGAFEIVDPLQKHADAQMADVATRVFSYFIPNDCD